MSAFGEQTYLAANETNEQTTENTHVHIMWATVADVKWMTSGCGKVLPLCVHVCHIRLRNVEGKKWLNVARLFPIQR